jgi:hypothetical protein
MRARPSRRRRAREESLDVGQEPTLAAGALATPQGSVATLIAADLAGARRRRSPLAAAAVLAATLLLWTTL